MAEMQETITVLLNTAHSAEPEPVEVPARVGHVKLGPMLGEGAGGVVFVGSDEILGRQVAVKLLHRMRGASGESQHVELVEGLRSAAKVKHPNIVTIHSVSTVSGMPVIVMEFVDGASMRDVLLAAGRVDAPLGEFMMRSVVAAVSALHAESVVHRDLKPANILFDRHGEAHVCDFGLACGFDAGGYRGRSDTIAGSPLYMAPEAFEGEVSSHSDVYSLGVMLFEVLAGRAPYQADSIHEIQARHARDEPPLELLAPTGVRAGMIEVVRRCLNKQRYLRYKSAGHMLRALEEAATPGPRDDVLRARLAALVASRRDAPRAEQAARPASPVSNTFDLIAERARRKRLEREQ